MSKLLFSRYGGWFPVAAFVGYNAECKEESMQGEVFGHPALRHGFPQTAQVAASEHFVASFDFRTRNANWVVEHLTSDSVRKQKAVNRKNSSFHEARNVPERFRSRLSDYKDSGYDRGHLAPAADHNKTQETMRDTFSLMNVSPQVGPGFNRDYWARFEHFCRRLTRSCDEVTVITGPLFLPSNPKTLRVDHATIGSPPSLVHVPTHFFKIVLTETRPRSSQGGAGYAVGAFVMPNSAIGPDRRLKDFVVPLEALEAAAGVLVFAKLLTPERRDRLRLVEGANNKHPLLLLLEQGNSKALSKKQKKQLKLPTDITHLCDRHACELVNAAIFNGQHNKKAKQKQPFEKTDDDDDLSDFEDEE